MLWCVVDELQPHVGLRAAKYVGTQHTPCFHLLGFSEIYHAPSWMHARVRPAYIHIHLTHLTKDP